MADVPLPEPMYTLPFPDDDELAFSAPQMHTHAAAVTAAKDAEIAALRETSDAAKAVGIQQENIIMEQERRIKVLEDESAALRAEVAQLREYLDIAQRRASALGDEVAGLREDAERYRWLRDVHEHHYTVTRVVGGALIPRLHGPTLDAAIDDAMAARKGTT